MYRGHLLRKSYNMNDYINSKCVFMLLCQTGGLPLRLRALALAAGCLEPYELTTRPAVRLPTSRKGLSFLEPT